MSNYEALSHSGGQVNSTAVIRVSIKKLYSVFIGILPLCMFFKFPFLEYGVGTVLSAAFLPYVLLSLVNRRSKTPGNILIGLYFLYLIIRSASDAVTMVLLGIAFVHIIGAGTSIDYAVCKKTVITVSIVASWVIIIQRLLAMLGLHVSFFATALMTEDFQEVTSVLTGQELTRMSGLFAEPSHFAEYALIGLILIIMQPNRDSGRTDFKNALVITVAVLASTSGIGMAGAAAIWVYYMLFHSKTLRKYPMLVRVGIMVAGAAVVFLILYQIPSFRLSITRIFSTVDGYNAVEGRNLYSDIYLSRLEGSSLVWGLGPVEAENFLLAYVKIIYQYGIVGIVLLALGLLRYIILGRQEVKTICLIYIGFLIASGMTGFLNYIFYICVIANTYAASKTER